METEHVDLSPLDPRGDAARWRSFVDETLERVDTGLVESALRNDDALAVIAHWRRRLLVTAAAVVTLLIPAEIALELREAKDEVISRVASASVSWVRGDQSHSGARMLRALAMKEPR